MKNLHYILFLLPLSLMAQYDFETRYFTINASSLPEVETLSSFDVSFASKKDFRVKSITEYNKVTVDNYRTNVDMVSAFEKESSFTNSEYNAQFLNRKYTSQGVVQYERDASTKVENTVYQEQRGLFFMDACPPFGVCPRCAAFRGGRGF